MKNDQYININEIARIKGLTTTRSIRQAIQKGKYIARKIKVNGGESYEILYSSLEIDLQVKISQSENSSTALVPINNNIVPAFISDNAKQIANARTNIVHYFEQLRADYKTKKETEVAFLDLYNSGLLLKETYKFLGDISVQKLHRWLKDYKEFGYNGLLPKWKVKSVNDEYQTKLTKEQQQIFLKFLLDPKELKIGTAINYTIHILKKQGCEDIPCELTFRRFADEYKKKHYDLWVLIRKGEKAYHDEIEPCIKRNISKLEVGDVFITDGHVLNFQVINPHTGKPCRPTLVGFLDWKSNALVGYEIMMTENTQCIASALRNAILNLDMIPKVIYQDNGRAFKAKYFQSMDFDDSEFNGLYASLGIKSKFATPYNARAKVIERFFLTFQEQFERLMPTYIGTSIENKPAWLNRNEKLHAKLHQKQTGGYIPTVDEVKIYIDAWLKDFYNKQPCPHNKNLTIEECLNTVKKQNIDRNLLNNLMLTSKYRTVNKHGITFLGLHYRHDALLGYRDQVYIKYSLFDLTTVDVYSLKGEYICTANQVEEIHPMATEFGTVRDQDEYNFAIRKQKQRYNKIKKEFKKYHPQIDAEIIEIKPHEPESEIEEIKPTKTVRERKLTPREQQMNRPLFRDDFEKCDWLMAHGCTSAEDRVFLTKFLQSDTYKLANGGVL